MNKGKAMATRTRWPTVTFGVRAAHAQQLPVEELLDRVSLRQAGEPPQDRQREARQPQPLDVEVVLRLPREREVRHLLRAHPGGPHRAPDRSAGAADDLGRLDASLLEGAR